MVIGNWSFVIGSLFFVLCSSFFVMFLLSANRSPLPLISPSPFLPSPYLIISPSHHLIISSSPHLIISPSHHLIISSSHHLIISLLQSHFFQQYTEPRIHTNEVHFG